RQRRGADAIAQRGAECTLGGRSAIGRRRLGIVELGRRIRRGEQLCPSGVGGGGGGPRARGRGTARGWGGGGTSSRGVSGAGAAAGGGAGHGAVAASAASAGGDSADVDRHHDRTEESSDAKGEGDRRGVWIARGRGNDRLRDGIQENRGEPQQAAHQLLHRG